MIPGARRALLRRLGLAVLAGGFGALGLSPVGLWPVTLLVLPVLPWLMLAAADARQAALLGWGFAAGWFLAGLHWIVEPFLVAPEVHGWMAPFALVFMAGGLALFWGLGFGLAHRIGRSAAARVWLLLPLLGLAELARAYLLTGFPWAGLAQIWVDSDAALLLAWIGPHGLGVATLLAALPPGLAMARRARPRAAALALVPALALLGAVLLVARLAGPEPSARPGQALGLGPGLGPGQVSGSSSGRAGQTGPGGRVVRLVQPNAPQHLKWHPRHMPVFFRRALELTAGGARPDLVVWPETSVPLFLDEAGLALREMAEAARGAPLVAGIRRAEGGRVYNSLITVGAEGRVGQIYDKHHLVPFGEYIPLGDLAARFGIYGLAAGMGNGFSAGPGPVLLDLGPLGRALPLICYEAVFPQDVGAAPARPDFLLQITNDAWFGQFSGPWQHLAQAQMRAIEQGLPMLRAANTGISAAIDPWGRVQAMIPLGQAGRIDVALPEPLPPTIYARLGDAPVFVLLLLALMGLVWAQSRPLRRIFV